jgi:metallo-beta-lactamase family protein
MAIKLSFLGAAQNVTGSRFLVETNGFKLLVDCGLYQERQLRERNWDPFPVPPADIDAVLLTHAHLDHCGWLPKLVKDGFNGKVYCTEATAEIGRIVLLDCGHIQEEDAEYKRKRHKRSGKIPQRSVVPLYTSQEAEASFGLFSPVKYEQTIEVTGGIEATFYDAGHILGASMIKLNIKCNGQSRSILFSGDVGREGKPILRDPTVFSEADYVIIESTYGDRTHETLEDTREKLAEAVRAAKKAGGNIIVPSFAIERSQEVLYYLNELLLEDAIPHLMVFLDSPMAIRELLSRDESPFDFTGLKMAKTTKQSKAINHIRGTVMIIAGSGMCTGGRVKHHLVNNISRPESTLLFVGYQAVGTLGRHIVENAGEIRILGETHEVKANIVQVLGFSAHADKNELFNWLSNLKNPPRHVFVVHGETNAAHHFSKFVNAQTGWKTSVPAYNDNVTLD